MPSGPDPLCSFGTDNYFHFLVISAPARPEGVLAAVPGAVSHSDAGTVQECGEAFLRVLALVPPLFVAVEAGAESTEQVLDTIAVFGQQQAGTIDWGTPPSYTPAYSKLPAFPIASSLRACKLTSNSGLFCLDSDKNVWNWSNPASSAPGHPSARAWHRPSPPGPRPL